MKFWAVFLALMLALTSIDALAQKRFGGGGSFGQQSGNVQRNATPAQPAQAPGQRAGQQATPNQAPASRPWGAMLGGLAAGLGLAWLASSLGLGEELAVFLLLLLAGFLVLAIVGFFVMRSRMAAAGRSPLAFQGAGNAQGGNSPFMARSGYQPGNVGNDASARPWERSSQGYSAPAAPTAQGGSLIGSALGGGSALSGSQSWGVPADFDSEGFVRASKSNFIRIQQAWDEGDIAALRALMTDEMVEHIQAQLSQRAGQPQRNEVLMLEARLLGIEERASDYMASVEFSGMMREDGTAGPTPLREVWNITRPKSGPGGWLVAGVQALD